MSKSILFLNYEFPNLIGYTSIWIKIGDGIVTIKQKVLRSCFTSYSKNVALNFPSYWKSNKLALKSKCQNNPLNIHTNIHLYKHPYKPKESYRKEGAQKVCGAFWINSHWSMLIDEFFKKEMHSYFISFRFKLSSRWAWE